jgi:hypothetical protein
VALHHGGFKVNAVAFNNKADQQTPTVDMASCSAWATVTGPVTVLDGSGDYAGIQGSIRISTSFAYIGPRFKTGSKKGACDTANSAAPLDVFSSSIIGSGKVTF